MIKNGIEGIMTAHLNIPSLDTTPDLPGTMSLKIIKNLLTDSLCFDGLIFTDALNMKGITRHFSSGEISRGFA